MKKGLFLAIAVLALFSGCGGSGAIVTNCADTSSCAAPDNNNQQPSNPQTPDIQPPSSTNCSDLVSACPPINLSVTNVTSSSISLSWDTIPNATKTVIKISPEPFSTNIPSREITTLAPEITEYSLTGISAVSNIFVQVSTETPVGTTTETVRSKTIGGPRATLGTSLREVHGYAPNILQLVLKDGSGTTWQNGPWTVKRNDGSDIAVTNVYRHSIPVSASDYSQRTDDPNFYNINSDDVTETDHRIYLVLDQNIGNSELLSIEGPNGLSFTLPFSDKYLETPVIQLNQVGYNPRATKRYAYVSGWIGDGGPLDLSNFPSTAEILIEDETSTSDPTVVLNSLTLNERSALDTDAGTEVKEIDLSSLPQSETNKYKIRIPGVGVSWKTEVSEASAFKAFYVVMRGLFFNRWGGDLRSDLTNWPRGIDHPIAYLSNSISDFDTKFPESEPITSPFSLSGGYHDAGDFDQRPMHTVVPQLLLRAYELNPSNYADNQLNIPESGNGIPDILDEALWGIKAWETLQDQTDGGVRQGVESYRHPLYSFANFDTNPYWTYTKDPRVSARAAGIFAQAARLIEPFDSAKSADLRTKAEKAFDYAVANQTAATANFLFYAASELFKLTGESKYNDSFVNNWKVSSPDLNWWVFINISNNQLSMSRYADGIEVMPDYILGYYASNGSNASIKESIDFWINKYALERADDVINSGHAHRNARPGSYEMTWGQGVSVSRFLDPAIARMQMGNLTSEDEQTLFNALSLSADYTLGANPNGFVYITGLGSRHPMEPLHTDSLIFIKQGKGAMPGIPVYGPVDSQGGASYILPTLNAFYPSYSLNPIGLRYADTRPLVGCSEFSVWEMQAPLAELFAILAPSGYLPSSLPEDSCGIDHCDK